MLCKSSSQNSILGSAMIFGLKLIRLSLEHYTTGIFSTVSSSVWHISHFRRTWILNRCTSPTRRVTEYTVRSTPATGGGIRKISFLPQRLLCQSFVHPTRLTGPIFQAIGMPGCWLSRSVMFEKISAVHLLSVPGFFLGWSPVPWKVPKIQTMHGFPRLEQCCPNSGILTSPALAWNGILPMYSRDDVILVWRPPSGIIQNKSRLLKSHMAHARCVKFLKVRRWGIQLVEHSITH